MRFARPRKTWGCEEHRVLGLALREVGHEDVDVVAMHRDVVDLGERRAGNGGHGDVDTGGRRRLLEVERRVDAQHRGPRCARARPKQEMRAGERDLVDVRRRDHANRRGLSAGRGPRRRPGRRGSPAAGSRPIPRRPPQGAASDADGAPPSPPWVGVLVPPHPARGAHRVAKQAIKSERNGDMGVPRAGFLGEMPGPGGVASKKDGL